MKRVLTFLAVMLLPLSLMAMTPVSDASLSDVTGQAGVNINADLTMDVSIGTIAWGDSTGVDAEFAAYGWTPVSGGGYVGITGFNITGLIIKARETDTFDTYTTLQLKPITIDVADAGGSSGLYGGRTFVRIGLGSLQIMMDAMDFNVALGDYSTPTLDQRMGVVSLGAMAIYIDPKSYIDIYSKDSCGVKMTMSIEIDEFSLGYVSWGDTDGLAGGNVATLPWMHPLGNSAGYVGLENLKIGGPIIISGSVGIDVATTALGIYSHNTTPTSVVHIGFDGNPLDTVDNTKFRVLVTGPITANVKLDAVAGLNGAGAKTLGDIYVSGFGLDIYAGSWVDIWAH